MRPDLGAGATPDGGALPSIAVLTQARDEGDLLRLWVEHHARQVGRENLVVFDDHSTDGSTEDLGCTVHRLPSMPGGHRFESARMALMSGVAEGLLSVYDYVAFTDVDELLVPDPSRHPSLAHLLLARGRPEVLGVTALDLVHAPGEPALDLTAPILEQRRYAKFAPVMCKPAVKRVPVPWERGSHGIAMPFAVDPELFMIHLKFADRDRLAAVARRRHEAHLVDNRAPRSPWARPAEQVVDMLDRGVAGFDPATVREFAPTPEQLVDVVVEKDGGVFRTRPGGMRTEPVVAVPPRLRGAL
jgi:hypothetical protein